MRHEIAIYLGLLICSLAGSYWASLPESEEKDSYQTLFNLAIDSIFEVSLESDKQRVSLVKKSDNKRFWVEIEQKAKGDKVNEQDDENKTVEKEENEKQSESDAKIEKFIANDNSDKLLKHFSPFQAIRSVGIVGTERLAEFGLDKDIETLRIRSTNGKEDFSYIIGGKSYGTQNSFIMDTKSKNVFLIARNPIDTLEKAKRTLFQKELFNSNFDDITSASIVSSAKTKVINHGFRDEKGELQWTDVGESKANVTYKNWMDKIKRLNVLSYPSEEEITRLQDVEDFLQLDFKDGSKSIETLKFKKSLMPALKDGAPKVYDYWAYSQFLSTWVKISRNRMESIEKDIASVIDGGK
ncbi:MAG: DUF4340 domain-containing protein [Bdellovibrionota bacterium]